LANPQASPQRIRVTLLGRPEAPVRDLFVAGRGRTAIELGESGLRGDFGVEVRCSSVCAAGLVMWDAGMKTANTSVPVTGCEVLP
jgi:hypothetical protein